MPIKNNTKSLVITKQWLEQAECFYKDGSLNVKKLNSLTEGHNYIIDEVTFLIDKKVNHILKKIVQIRRQSYYKKTT
ncbi:hypothetical protein NKS28_27955 [Bacillus sp. 1663tsa1]|uniref:hypothetical protein n=1 Tax=Bacillus sp. 1663tsa1 TaxID=2953804 RepID=UPI00209DFA42|nr:hypothetical protein [Bacillus sp. 1663tsa1]MCP1181249.1 hypothetical protein [Bacillus sp. 1663tsa1]